MKRTRKHEIEEWRDIPGYEGSYRASSFGKIRSLKRVIVANQYSGTKTIPEKILKPRKNKKGYMILNLSVRQNHVTWGVHVLVCMCFHNYIPSSEGFVPNHIDHDKTNNRADNLEVGTIRENNSKKKFKKPPSSKYIGVCWRGDINKWRACITVNKKKINLGSFENEDEAGAAYQKALSELPIQRRRTKFIKYT